MSYNAANVHTVEGFAMFGTIRRWYKRRSLYRHIQILAGGVLIFILFWSVGQIADQPFPVFDGLSWLTFGLLTLYTILLVLFNPNGEEPTTGQE